MDISFEPWRCKYAIDDERKFCPDEGCAKSFGCARDKGWLPGMPSPPGCDGIIRRDR